MPATHSKAPPHVPLSSPVESKALYKGLRHPPLLCSHLWGKPEQLLGRGGSRESSCLELKLWVGPAGIAHAGAPELTLFL